MMLAAMIEASWGGTIGSLNMTADFTKYELASLRSHGRALVLPRYSSRIIEKCISLRVLDEQEYLSPVFLTFNNTKQYLLEGD